MNRIITLAEVAQSLYQIALDQVGGDDRAAKVLLALSSPMVEMPPKKELQYLKDVLSNLEKSE